MEQEVGSVDVMCPNWPGPRFALNEKWFGLYKNVSLSTEVTAVISEAALWVQVIKTRASQSKIIGCLKFLGSPEAVTKEEECSCLFISTAAPSSAPLAFPSFLCKGGREFQCYLFSHQLMSCQQLC